MALYLNRMCQRGTLVTHRYTYAPLRCRTSQYLRTFITLPVFLWNDLANLVLNGVGLAGFKRRANAFFYWSKLLYPYYSLPTIFLFLFFLSIGWYCGAWGFGLIGCISVFLSLALPTFF